MIQSENPVKPIHPVHPVQTLFLFLFFRALSRFSRTLLLFFCSSVVSMAIGSLFAAEPDPKVAELRREVAPCGWIVFSAHPAELDKGVLIGNRGARGQLDLYLARPDGSELRNLTKSDELHEFGVRFSADGKKILYRRCPKGEAVGHDHWGEQGELVVANADGSNPVSLGKNREFPWATWSPDLKQIACLYRKEGLIRIHDVETKQIVQEMPSQGIYQQLVWSPDGKRLVGTANVSGQMWNIVSYDLATRKTTLLSRFLNCTPDWFQSDPSRVIYSNRIPGITTRLDEASNRDGFTILMQATADGKQRTLVYGRLRKHVYFGCTSPDGKYAIFADDPADGLIVGEMHLVRMADTPIVAPQPEFPELKEKYPEAKDGPVLDLTLPNGTPLRGFEPHWTAAPIGR